LEAPRALRRQPSAKASERALLKAARRGSEPAIEALVRRHWDAAHRAAYLIVHDPGIAEDISQEAIVATIRSLDRFDRRRPLRPYLHRIVVNRSLDWLRAQKARPEISVEQPAVLAQPTEPAVDQAPLSGGLLAAMATLQPEDRAAVVLRHVLDYRSREVAEFLGIDPSTARSRLSRALQQLRAALEREGGKPDGL
jgi:RNA polymerase sigma-70 factor (ECF subfamily)